MKAAVVLFPGSNCESDAFNGLKLSGFDPYYLWHKNSSIEKNTCLTVIPGGFSFGDYLRCGAIASHSPVMKAVKSYARSGGLVIGICNGFQVLTESGLLPGILQINNTLKFRCHNTFLRCENTDTPFTRNVDKIMRLPIAHFEGNYQDTPENLDKLVKNGQIAFRYADQNGNIDSSFNPNGAVLDIAGIFNREKNVLGMMPHPERALEKLLGSDDGKLIFDSVKNHLNSAHSGGKSEN